MIIEEPRRAAFGLVLLLIGSTASAVPMLRSNSAAIVNGSVSNDTSVETPLATSGVSGNEFQSSGAVDTAGNIGVSTSFFGASGSNANLSSQSFWRDSFDFTAGDTATFDFFIPSAVIAFEANNVGGLFGSVAVSVELNGVAIFSTFAQVTTLVGTPRDEADLGLSQTGTDLLSASFETGLAPGFGLGGAGYRFGSFTGSLDLNPVVGTNELTYRMRAAAIGLIGETSAIASIGDPLNLTVGGSTINVTPGTPVAVAEPGPLMMLALGLFAACAARRR